MYQLNNLNSTIMQQYSFYFFAFYCPSPIKIIISLSTTVNTYAEQSELLYLAKDKDQSELFAAKKDIIDINNK